MQNREIKKEGADLLQDEQLRKLVFEERGQRDKGYIGDVIFMPLLGYPLMLLAMYYHGFSISIIIALGVLVYGYTFWRVWEHRRLNVDQRTFGYLGDNLDDIEQYCHRAWKRIAFDLAFSQVYLWVFLLGMWYLGKVNLESPYWILVFFLILLVGNTYRAYNRSRQILARIEFLRSNH